MGPPPPGMKPAGKGTELLFLYLDLHTPSLFPHSMSILLFSASRSASISSLFLFHYMYILNCLLYCSCFTHAIFRSLLPSPSHFYIPFHSAFPCSLYLYSLLRFVHIVSSSVKCRFKDICRPTQHLPMAAKNNGDSVLSQDWHYIVINRLIQRETWSCLHHVSKLIYLLYGWLCSLNVLQSTTVDLNSILLDCAVLIFFNFSLMQATFPVSMFW